MYDSTGKQAAGVFVGATTWAGNFEECLNIEATSCMPDRGLCQEQYEAEPQFCSVHMTHAPWRPKMIAAIVSLFLYVMQSGKAMTLPNALPSVKDL